MRKKRANGAGCIFRRGNPPKWTVEVTVGFNEKGGAIQKSLGRFETYAEAEEAIEDYKNSPYAWSGREFTLAQMWEIFREKRLPNFAKSSRSGFITGFNHCGELHNLRYAEIVQMRIQDVLNAHAGHYPAQVKIRNLFSHLNSLAFELGLDIKKIRPELLKLSKYEAKITKKVFTEEEIRRVKKFAENDYWGKVILSFLYTGLRFTELTELKKSDYNRENQTIKGGIKTDAGRGRIVPVHPILQEFFGELADKNEPYLFGGGGKPLRESELRDGWNGVMDALGLNHTPHECRHTFETRMRLAGADEVTLDKIIGHKSGHVGRDVYTHFDADVLHREIAKLT
jgi:integrase